MNSVNHEFGENLIFPEVIRPTIFIFILWALTFVNHPVGFMKYLKKFGHISCNFGQNFGQI